MAAIASSSPADAGGELPLSNASAPGVVDVSDLGVPVSIRGSVVRLGAWAPPAALRPIRSYAQLTRSSVTDAGEVSAGSGGPVAVAPNPTGTREQALAAKRAAPNLVEIRPQSEIRKLPDVNIAEALQRLPGVSVETDTAEGRFVNVRGLDSDFNSVTYGGVRLMPSNQASPLGGSRAIALDSIPAGLVGAIELVKSNRPDQDAESLGAAIELVPRPIPQSGRPFLEMTGAGGAEPLRGSPRVAGSITFGGTFGFDEGTRPWEKPGEASPRSGSISNPRPFGVLGTASFDNDQLGVDDIEAAYANTPGTPNKVFQTLELRRYDYFRRRYSRGGEFEFRPNEANRFYFRIAQAGYTEHTSRHRLILDNLATGDANGNFGDGSGGFLAPQASITQSLRNVSEEIQTNVIAAGGSSVIANTFKVSYRGSYSEGHDYRPYDYNSTFANPNAVSLDYNNSNSTHPAVRTLDGTNLADPRNYLFSGINNTVERDRDREGGGAIDVSAPLALLGLNGELKGGAGVRIRNRSIIRDVRTYSPTDAGSALNLVNFSSGPSQIYYDNRYDIGPEPSGNINNVIGNPLLVARNTATDAIRSAAGYQNDHENVYAQYFQYNARAGRLGLLAGIRFEETQGNYRANITTTAADGTQSVSPATNRQSYFNYFPTVQARYDLSPTTLGRVAYSTAIGRPGFNQNTAATTVNIGNNSVTTGNPNLKPITANSFDVSIEQTLPNGGIASIQGFDKEFQNYILGRQVVGAFPGIAGVTAIQSFSNAASGARAYGAELAYVQKFVALPAPFNGLGVDANYTFVQSRVELRSGEFKSLPSTSNHNFNVAAFYEDGPYEFRVAASYVSKNLFAVGASRNTDIFSQPRFRLDLTGSYEFIKGVNFFVAARNLTDTALKFTESGRSTRPIQREFYGPTVFAGLRSTF